MDPLALKSPSGRPFLHLLGVSSLVFFATLAMGWRGMGEPVSDSQWYLAMAEGRSEEVIQPFSSRILMPAAARLLRSFGLSTRQAFAALNLLSLAVLVLAVTRLVQLFTGSAWPAGAAIFSPLLVGLFQRSQLVDLFHAALVALFFWALCRRLTVIGPALLLLAQLARETTALLGLWLAALAWRRGRPRWVWASVAAVGSGWLAVWLLSGPGASNRHALGGVPYLSAKLVFNAFRNYLGVQFHTDTLGNCSPVWSVQLPDWLPSGAIREIGFCAFDPATPLWTFLMLLTLFGVLPAVLTAWLWGRGKAWADGLPLALQLCAAYGVTAFLLGPATGSRLERLAGYGWPAFWIAAPALLVPMVGDRRSAAVLAVGHQAVCWTPYVAFHWLARADAAAVTAVLALTFNAVAFATVVRLVKRV